VRLVLVPAVMELLGKANWWLPKPLARLLDRPGAGQPQDEAEAHPAQQALPAQADAVVTR